VKGDKDVYHRLTGMINADYKIKPWMKVGTTTTFEKWDSKAVSENSEYGSLLASVLTMDPLTPDVFDAANLPDYMKTLVTAGKVLLKNESGQYYGISRVYSSEQIHPMAMRDKTDYRNSGSNILGTMYSDFTPIKGLRITSKLGYRLSFTNNYSFNNIYYANAMAFNDKIGVSRTSSNNLYYQWENFANYDFSIGKSKVNTMAGISYSDATATSVTGGGNEITKDSPLFRDLDYLTATATKTTSGGYSYSRQFSYFGRFSYDYAGKYLLQASVRRDAGDASILPITNRWGTFPAFSAGYIISNERFYPKNLGIDYMKIRSSWGQNGSTGPLGGYAYQASITSSGTYPFYNQIAYQTASSPNRLNNTELKWETSEQLDFGFDIRALRDRLTFTFDYFDKKTKDLLVAVAPPYETGVSSVTVNAGDVSNKGFEFELGWTDRINDFSYSIRSNLATLKNNVTYLDPSISRIDGASYHTTTGITSFQVGEPVWYMRGYQLLSIDKATGDPVFKDQNADGVINDADKVKIGSAIPDYTYGITLTAAYKGFDITGFGTGSQGNNIFNALTRVDRPRGNKLKVFYDDRWTANHTDASRPRPNANGEDKYWDSNGVIFDGSYFKIKQIQIGYTLPQQLVRKAFISSMRMYVSFDDWFVFTKYPGMDPESSAGSTSAMGVDKGSYPTSKKAVFGINVTF
jgi:TonB-linked SusC/RagA family outer membrane protein